MGLWERLILVIPVTLPASSVIEIHTNRFFSLQCSRHPITGKKSPGMSFVNQSVVSIFGACRRVPRHVWIGFWFSLVHISLLSFFCFLIPLRDGPSRHKKWLKSRLVFSFANPFFLSISHFLFDYVKARFFFTTLIDVIVQGLISRGWLFLQEQLDLVVSVTIISSTVRFLAPPIPFSNGCCALPLSFFLASKFFSPSSKYLFKGWASLFLAFPSAKSQFLSPLFFWYLDLPLSGHQILVAHYVCCSFGDLPR